MNYLEGKIYKIVSDETDKIYIGSTTKTLEERFKGHKYDFKYKHIYFTSYEILKYPDARIELICEFPCNSKEELEKEEGNQIRKYFNICVNEVIPGRTNAEYYQDHKEYYKEWRKENKEFLASYHKNYYQNNKEKMLEKVECECGEFISKNSLNRHKNRKVHIERMKAIEDAKPRTLNLNIVTQPQITKLTLKIINK